MNKIEIPYEKIYDEYVTKQKNIREVAKALNISHMTAEREIRRHNIPTRPKNILKDLTNIIVGNWTVIRRDENTNNSKSSNSYWICQCKCGMIKSINSWWLRQQKPIKCAKCESVTKFEIGDNIGRWTIVDNIDKHIGLVWLCRCDCGEIREIKNSALKKGMNTCTNCVGLTGHKEISGGYLRRIKSGAKSRNIEYNVSNIYLWNLYIKQNRKCTITGFDIGFTTNYANDVKSQTASLDRIDSTKGYIEGNVQWVYKVINMMKTVLPQECFIEICNVIATNNPKIINSRDLLDKINSINLTAKVMRE